MNQSASFVLAVLFLPLASGWTANAPSPAAVPMIHVTDLFRPHVDPDDHWDLACVFALAYRGEIDLKAVLLDYPPPNNPGKNPDIAAVAQLNYLTGLAVPVAVGSPHPMKTRDDSQPQASRSDDQGIDLALRILRESDRPVVINVIGSCRTMAVAANKAPDLFANKCAGIYLNAGTGSPDPSRSKQLEYNVSLAPLSYAALFDVPCPVYWMPCFEDLGTGDKRSVREFGTHYAFVQRDILPALSPRLQNFFMSMLGRKQDHRWLDHLAGSPNSALLEKFSAQTRHMWCTAGFFHAAGLGVQADGAIVRSTEEEGDLLCSFDPIHVTCSDEGRTQWKADPASRRRFIFHVRDRDHYAAALTQAMKTLLKDLP